MNKVILMGRLTADPVLRQTQSGSTSCSFTVAINRRIVNKQTGERDADFIRCTAWNQTAEFVNRYFKKGSMICVEGELRSGSYQDRNHPDVTHYTTDVWVSNVEFTGEKAGNGNNNYNNNSYSAPQGNYNNYSAPQDNYNSAPQNNYNNNYSAPPQQSGATDNNSMSYGNMNDYEEILSDGNVPF